MTVKFFECTVLYIVLLYALLFVKQMASWTKLQRMLSRPSQFGTFAHLPSITFPLVISCNLCKICRKWDRNFTERLLWAVAEVVWFRSGRGQSQDFGNWCWRIGLWNIEGLLLFLFPETVLILLESISCQDLALSGVRQIYVIGAFYDILFFKFYSLLRHPS